MRQRSATDTWHVRAHGIARTNGSARQNDDHCVTLLGVPDLGHHRYALPRVRVDHHVAPVGQPATRKDSARPCSSRRRSRTEKALCCAWYHDGTSKGKSVVGDGSELITNTSSTRRVTLAGSAPHPPECRAQLASRTAVAVRWCHDEAIRRRLLRLQRRWRSDGQWTERRPPRAAPAYQQRLVSCAIIVRRQSHRIDQLARARETQRAPHGRD